MKAKRILTLIAALWLTIVIHAQTDPKVKAQVEDIRRMYAEAKQLVAHSEEPDQDWYEDMEIHRRQMVGGVGMVYETQRYFYLSDFDEERGYEMASLHFLTRRYNSAARQYYEEYLFDPESGQLVFAFLQGDNAFTGEKDETRYYWHNGELIHQQTKGEPLLDDMLTQRTASDLSMVFHTLVNRVYE